MKKTIEFPGIHLPEIDDATRREFLIGAAGLLLLPAACGSGENGEPSGETRAIEHEFGTTEVPVNAERVLTTSDAVEFDSLLALGRKPMATGILYERSEFTPWTEGQDVSGIETFPSVQTGVNVETVATFDPDLVMIPARDLKERMFDQLSQVAPTVPTASQQPGNANAWRDVLSLVAECVGEEEMVDSLAREVEDRLAEVRGRVEELGLTEVSLVSPYTGQGLFVFGNTSPQGLLLREIGFTRPADQRELSGDGSEKISLENIPDLDTDLLLVIESDPAAMEELEEDELFKQLAAVREGRYVRVPEEISSASFFQSVLSLPWAAEKYLEVIEAALAGNNPA